MVFVVLVIGVHGTKHFILLEVPKVSMSVRKIFVPNFVMYFGLRQISAIDLLSKSPNLSSLMYQTFCLCYRTFALHCCRHEKTFKISAIQYLRFLKCPHFLKQNWVRNAQILTKVGQMLWQMNQFFLKWTLRKCPHFFVKNVHKLNSRTRVFSHVWKLGQGTASVLYQ